MDPLLLAVIALGAKAFASGALGFVGAQTVKSLLSESDASRLENLYIEGCNDVFEALGPDGTEEEIERLAHFFGTERVGEEVAKWSMQGEPLDFQTLLVVWKEQGGAPETLAAHMQSFEGAYRVRAMETLPFELRLGFSLIRSEVISRSPASANPIQPTVGQGPLESAEERIRELQTELLRQFESRLDSAVRNVKEAKQYRTGLLALEALEAEAKESQEILSHPELVHKLYVNLTVCYDRLGDHERTLRSAEAAVAAKGQDARSLHNLAVTKVRTEGATEEVRSLIDSALSVDTGHRPAVLLKIALLANEDPRAALDQIRSLEWLEDDPNAQYALSGILLSCGERRAAIDAAARAVELEGSPDQCSSLAQLLIQDDLQDGSIVMDFRIRGIGEPDSSDLDKAVELFQRAADTYRREERVSLAEVAETNIARSLMRLGRDEEATPTLERLIADGETAEAVRAAYANLIEIELGKPNTEAVHLGAEACGRFPQAGYLHFSYGRALAADGQDAAAIKQFTVAVEGDVPEQLRTNARLYKVNCLVALKDLDGADAELGADFEPSPLAVNVRIRLLEARSGARAAADWAREIADENPQDAGIQVVVAQFLRQRGFSDEASAPFGRLVDLVPLPPSPTDDQALFWVRACYYSGSWERGLKLDARLVSNEHIRADILVMQSRALQQLERYEDALELLERLVDEFPSRHDIVEGLAIASFQLGRPNRAIPYMERLAHSPDSTPIDRMNLAVLYALAGDVGASVREAEAALAGAPNDRLVAGNCIRLMVRGGKTDAAVRLMEDFVQRFPDSDSIQIWRGTPDELSQRLLEEVVLPAKERHETMAEYYSRHPYPVGFMAKSLGRSYINLWYGIRAGELGKPFQTGRGLESLGEELDATTMSKSVVLDESSLLTLGLLNLLSVLPNLYDSILIPQEAVADIRNELVDHDDGLLRSILADIERHSTTMAVAPPSDGSGLNNREVEEALGEQESAALALAKSRDIPLFSDDLAIRDLAKGMKMPVFGTRSLIERASNVGLVERSGYAQAIIGLVQSSYYFVTFNSLVLAHAMRTGDEVATALLSFADRPDADLKSYVRVFAGALCELWIGQESTGSRTASEWTVRLLLRMLGTGGSRLAGPMVLYLVACVAKEKPTALRPLMYAVSELAHLDDENVVFLLTFVSFFLGKAGKEDEGARETGRLFIEALGMTWRTRVRALLRAGAPQEYQILFD